MKQRIRVIQDHPVNEDGQYVLYWMQHTQRIHQNGALHHAVLEANRLEKPLKVVFCIARTFKDGADRHYHFMIEGLKDLRRSFETRGIDFTVTTGDFLIEIPRHFSRATQLVTDKAYVRPLREMRRKMTAEAESLRIEEVESDVSVPVEVASDKVEYAARTIRKKLWNALKDPSPLPEIPAIHQKAKSHAGMLDESAESIIKRCDINHEVGKVDRFKGGEREALRRFESFLTHEIHQYSSLSNDPGAYAISTLSPYLHFGMISPLHMLETIQKEVEDGTVEQADADAYLEQLIVRRELAFNYVYFFEDGYDAFESMTYGWAYKTMEAHKHDTREAIYDLHTLKEGRTHDRYWNACMQEMRETGFMHNYMRMYWGKKIIMWSRTYKEAYDTIRTLNNLYFLDGRDPNSYAGIAWCFGRHDRAFQERDVLGKLRPLSANGLRRKFDIETYVNRFSNE